MFEHNSDDISNLANNNVFDDYKEPSPDINKKIIPHIKNDYLLSQMHKNLDKENLNCFSNKQNVPNPLILKNNHYCIKNNIKNSFEENIEGENSNNDTSVIFTNSFIQISMQRANIIRKIFNRNNEISLKFYFEKWQKYLELWDRKRIRKTSFQNFNEGNSQDHLLKNTNKDEYTSIDLASRKLEIDLNKINEEILNNETSNKNIPNNFDYLNQNRKIIQNCLLDDKYYSVNIINKDLNKTLENNKINTNNNSEYDFFIDDIHRLNSNKTNKNTPYHIKDGSTSYKELNNKIFSKFEKEYIDNNDILYDSTYNSGNKHSFKISKSLKNEDSSPLKNSFAQSKIENNLNSNIPKMLSHEVCMDNPPNNNKLKNKIELFTNNIENHLIKIQKLFFYKFFLALYKRAFKEAGDVHCINTFRLFTKFSICKSKLLKLQNYNKNNVNIDSIEKLKSEKDTLIQTNDNLKKKIIEKDETIAKLDRNLIEKVEIIYGKNDTVQSLNEQIELLNKKNDKIVETYRDQIELLNKKIEKLEIKPPKLNIIQESLCHQCQSSLEESFMHDNSHPKLQSDMDKLKNLELERQMEIEKQREREQELKKSIHEQLKYIVKMEEELREVKLKNSDFKAKNEMILDELEIIKEEFNSLSQNIKMKNNKDFCDSFTQTQHIGEIEYPQFGCNEKNILNQAYKLNIDKNFDYTNGNNIMMANNQTNHDLNTINTNAEICDLKVDVNKNKDLSKKKNLSKTTAVRSFNSKNKQFSGKLVLPDNKDKKENNAQQQISKNVNTLNATNNTNINININNNYKSDLDLMLSERELLQNLKFDNSVLTKEIVGLNKELNKYKSESKILSDNFKKCEKERNEYYSKLKMKSESFDKLKKENEELMILIQTSNYKSFVSIETDNKRLKSDNSQLIKEIDAYKNDSLTKDKIIKDKETEYEKLKKNFENFQKIKNERENLILEKTKLESELRQFKFEMEELQKLTEKQNLFLKNKDECLKKLSEEFNYLNFNAKKLKQESDKNLQDAIAYQQIVRKMEKDLAECQIKKEKIENELKIIKANIMK